MAGVRVAHLVQRPRAIVRAILVYNPSAGGAGGKGAPDRAELVSGIEHLGWSVTVVGKADLERTMAAPTDVVLVAGGDGTVGKVAKRLAGTGIPMAVLPTGTANNVARTLGIGLEPRAALEALPRAVIREVDLGVVLHRGETERFLEGFGTGVFAYVMAERATKKHKKLRRAFRLLARELASFAPHHTRLRIDGRDASGEYLLVAVMNVRSFGPALALAPDARFDDGVLDVVLVHPEQRASLVRHLERAALEGDLALPQFEVHRAKQVVLSDTGGWAHVDDGARTLLGEVEIRVEPRAVRFLTPAPPIVELDSTARGARVASA